MPDATGDIFYHSRIAALPKSSNKGIKPEDYGIY